MRLRAFVDEFTIQHAVFSDSAVAVFGHHVVLLLRRFVCRLGNSIAVRTGRRFFCLGRSFFFSLRGSLFGQQFLDQRLLIGLRGLIYDIVAEGRVDRVHRVLASLVGLQLGKTVVFDFDHFLQLFDLREPRLELGYA